MPNVAGWPASCREGFGGGPQCLTLLSEAHEKTRGRPGTGQEKRQACQLPRRVWGRSTMPNVAGWPASGREGFGGGPQCLTLLSEAHKKTRGRPGTGQEKRQACQLPRGVWGRSTMPNVALGSP